MPISPTTSAHAPLARFPAEVRDAFAHFLAAGDVSALDTVLFAVIRDFLPRKNPVATGPLPDNARLIEDLGFDSLAIAEIVFFMEDLFSIKISNAEIQQVGTVGQLRAFVLHKFTAARPA
ncbi:MAG TPA: acyl carrier protein [Opitutaceae bacterium]|nr:acyl carrier protein [Opitutaceae bacterium]